MKEILQIQKRKKQLMRNFKGTFATLIISSILMGCTPKQFVGKYTERDNSCILLEHIEVLPDRTVLEKYISVRDEVQFNAKFIGEDTLVIPEQQRTWYFKLRNDTLFEISNIDYRCFLVKEKE